jgi:hypothetical protein
VAVAFRNNQALWLSVPAFAGTTLSLCPAPKRRIVEQDQSDLPSPVPSSEIFPFAADQIKSISTAVPSHRGGGSRSSRTRDGMRWTRAALLTRALCLRTAKSCGPDAPTLASSFAEAIPRGDGGKQARSPGRARRKPLKPLRGECRVFRCDRGDYACVLFYFAHKAAGASSARHSLRPLIRGRDVSGKTRARGAARSRRCIPTSLRGAPRRSNPCVFPGPMDCFASARNDGLTWLFEIRILKARSRAVIAPGRRRVYSVLLLASAALTSAR